ncbi:hypothetical protein B0H14DRAFT_2595600 [Mycena olivaceomarginata]|nr:hypothetical protein B0H14DRAFT_2595600 [Mycena olivaceomarginata]
MARRSPSTLELPLPPGLPPLGVRLAQYVSVFHAGLNSPAPWDNAPVEARGEANRRKRCLEAHDEYGAEGRQAAARRNCEGFGADPFLSGVGSCAHITRSTDAGVTDQQDYHWRVGGGVGVYRRDPAFSSLKSSFSQFLVRYPYVHGSR